jgi:hypothetical protein
VNECKPLANDRILMRKTVMRMTKVRLRGTITAWAGFAAESITLKGRLGKLVRRLTDLKTASAFAGWSTAVAECKR